MVEHRLVLRIEVAALRLDALHPFSHWQACFADVVIREPDDHLLEVCGQGLTPQDALADYLCRIEGRCLYRTTGPESQRHVLAVGLAA